MFTIRYTGRTYSLHQSHEGATCHPRVNACGISVVIVHALYCRFQPGRMSLEQVTAWRRGGWGDDGVSELVLVTLLAQYSDGAFM